MQKAIMLISNTDSVAFNLTELNNAFATGWRYVSATPVGVSTALTGNPTPYRRGTNAAVLVIVEKAGAVSVKSTKKAKRSRA
jgi:hypothetical protein